MNSLFRWQIASALKSADAGMCQDMPDRVITNEVPNDEGK